MSSKLSLSLSPLWVWVVEVVFEALGVMTVKMSHGVILRERFVGFGGGAGGGGVEGRG